jgi:hypothetical protein
MIFGMCAAPSIVHTQNSITEEMSDEARWPDRFRDADCLVTRRTGCVGRA